MRLVRVCCSQLRRSPHGGEPPKFTSPSPACTGLCGGRGFMCLLNMPRRIPETASEKTAWAPCPRLPQPKARQPAPRWGAFCWSSMGLQDWCMAPNAPILLYAPTAGRSLQASARPGKPCADWPLAQSGHSGNDPGHGRKRRRARGPMRRKGMILSGCLLKGTCCASHQVRVLHEKFCHLHA